MPLQHFRELVEAHCDAAHIGAYYGLANNLSLGAGLIYSGIQFPLYNSLDRQFEILEGLALVLTHECDLANEREFNDHVLICPILTLEAFVATFVERHGFNRAADLVVAIASNSVYRVFLLPPPIELLGLPEFANGGFLYLNQICSTHVSLFQADGVRQVCALSNYGQHRLDQKLTNHLLRPKEEELPRVN